MDQVEKAKISAPVYYYSSVIDARSIEETLRILALDEANPPELNQNFEKFFPDADVMTFNKNEVPALIDFIKIFHTTA